MQLHRPKSLDDLNVDFFSEDTSNDEQIEDINDFDMPIQDENVEFETEFPEEKSEKRIPQLPEKDPSEPYSKKEILEFLAEDFSKLDEVVDDIPFTGIRDSEQPTQEENCQPPLVDEKAALESFPDLSQSIIDLSAKPLSAKDEKQYEKEVLRQARDDAKASIDNEKKRIKEQKKLEKTVQRPFGKRRAAVILMVIFLIVGILASTASALIYAIDKSDNGLLKISDFSIGYVDGDKINSETHLGEYIFVKGGSIQGNDTLLFLNSVNVPTVADVIGFGDGLYAVDLGSTVYRVNQANILGSAKFKTPNLSFVRNIVVGYSFIVFGVLAIYLVLVILFSVLRISKYNAAIKKLKESYELV